MSPEDTRPIQYAQYRADLKAREFEKKEIAKILELEVIELAQPVWASPIIFARDKDSTLLFCVDYRNINALTVQNFYPNLHVEDCIDSLGDTGIFIDIGLIQQLLASRYCQRRQHESAFAPCHVLFQVIRLPC